MITAADVRAVALSLPRTEGHLIRDHIKFRVGKIVYASISPDELTMGIGFPKEQRDALIASEPEKFALPRLSDQRFHWVHARMAALDPDMRELVTDAWRWLSRRRSRSRTWALAAKATARPYALSRRPSRMTWSRCLALASHSAWSSRVR